MNRRLAPTPQLRWVDKKYYYYDSYDSQNQTISVLEQWHQNEVLTETHGWQLVEGGEWREVKDEVIKQINKIEDIESREFGMLTYDLGRRHEREECAKLCDESEYPDGIDLAYLIRARGQE